MKLYRTRSGVAVERDGIVRALRGIGWDEIFASADPGGLLGTALDSAEIVPGSVIAEGNLVAPVSGQEVWAAGVTYYRSRTARMEESEAARGADFYARVYTAPRPELFLKATPHRVVGHRQAIRIRSDSEWNVPEPELACAVNSAGRIFGYLIGNDVSSRDIEGENPLYLPQAKVYDQCCALGPGILLSDRGLGGNTRIEMEIFRKGGRVFEGATELARMKRTPEELVAYLFRDNSFPAGCILLTGTGIVPDPPFTLQAEDEVLITIQPIGTLANRVVQGCQ